MDFYAFRAEQGQEITFEVTASRKAVASSNFRPEISLYELEGSWFDADRPIRIAYTDWATGEKLIADTDPRLTIGTQISWKQRFEEEGRYFVAVESMGGNSDPKHVYQLRVSSQPKSPSSPPWVKRWPPWRGSLYFGGSERNFARRLEFDRFAALWRRGVWSAESAKVVQPLASAAPPAGSADADLEVPAPQLPEVDATFPSVEEKEPNETWEEAIELAFPGLVEGTIEKADDVDIFKMEIPTGQAVAFELETPESTVPQFNPWLKVIDERGNEVVTNLLRSEEFEKVTVPYLRSLEAKVTQTFNKGGTHYLEVRDMTSRYGNTAFRYRLLVRPQILPMWATSSWKRAREARRMAGRIRSE